MKKSFRNQERASPTTNRLGSKTYGTFKQGPINNNRYASMKSGMKNRFGNLSLTNEQKAVIAILSRDRQNQLCHLPAAKAKQMLISIEKQLDQGGYHRQRNPESAETTIDIEHYRTKEVPNHRSVTKKLIKDQQQKQYVKSNEKKEPSFRQEMKTPVQVVAYTQNHITTEQINAMVSMLKRERKKQLSVDKDTMQQLEAPALGTKKDTSIQHYKRGKHNQDRSNQLWNKAGENVDAFTREQRIIINRKKQKSRRLQYAALLGKTLDAEIKREAQTNEAKQELQQQYTIAGLEQAMHQRMGNLYSLPLKIRLSKLLHQGRTTLHSVSSGIFRYAIIFVVPLICVVMLFAILMACVGAMSEEEAIYSAAGEEIVSYAKEWVGVTRYILGAGRQYETDWQDYTDCSGFVHGVFSHFGYEIGGWTGTQQNAGTYVGTNTLEGAVPGDIILFYKNGVVEAKNHEHVAIYIGDGAMVHCAGGAANYSIETAGVGVCYGTVTGDGRPWMVRRIIAEGETGGIGSGGHHTDASNYSKSQLELIWAIVAQEDNGSYAGALAVISSAMNRAESTNWGYLGNNAMSQLTAPGQYCYSNDSYWQERLGGNVPSYVIQAVNDCLVRGIRNHSYTSFRSTKGNQTGANAVQIGGNWFFGN